MSETAGATDCARTFDPEAGARGPSAIAWHALQIADVLACLHTDPARGLAADAASACLARVGANELPEPTQRSLLEVFVGQLRSPLIYLLLAAAVVALGFGHLSDAAVILVVVLINAVVGSVQEGRAERSLSALRKLTDQSARVVRDGYEATIEARALVPGDVVVLEAGDAVPADARLLEQTFLQAAEAALTGESAPVSKQLGPLPPETSVSDRRNMLYAGTQVTAGRARAVVVRTGPATEIGRIAELASQAEEPRTPLERRVDRFGRMILVVAAFVLVVIGGVGALRDVPLAELMMLAISQVVGMIPEGLPVAMTIALAVGVQRMARRRAIVRRLSAVETLGSTTVICTDKTGTLTRNEMTAVAVLLPDGRALRATGAGYAPEGELRDSHGSVTASDPAVLALLEACVLCNDAGLDARGGVTTTPRVLGDPTEIALLTLAHKAGLAPAELRKRCPRTAELPFDPEAKLMATEHRVDGVSTVMLKGAPELVIALCGALRRDGVDVPIDAEARDAALQATEAMAAQALRVLAFARVSNASLAPGAGFSVLQGRAALLGLVGQVDPPRPEVKEAIDRCRQAGIRTVMVTGDHTATAHAIARELGIAREGDTALSGAELEALSDDALSAQIDRIAVFARVHPAQKLRIVDAYQRRGEVVAMTGDGVNDAPALVKADVGVAMGQTGTEVAKDASKIVIGDDDFSTIVAAVEEGRVVYRNIKKAVLLLFSTSAAEVLVLLLGMLLGYPPPFAAVQILWNNLVTEGLITVNLVLERAEGDEMRLLPTRQTEALLDRLLATRMAFMVLSTVSVTLLWFVVRLEAGVPEAQVRTETFTLLVICEWYNVLNCRSARASALSFSIFDNRWLVGGLLAGNLLQASIVFIEPLGRFFHTVPIGLTEVVALAAAGSPVLLVEELRKLIARRREGSMAVRRTAR